MFHYGTTEAVRLAISKLADILGLGRVGGVKFHRDGLLGLVRVLCRPCRP